MFDLFSTREIAMGIYIVVFLIYVLCHSKGRKAWFPVVKIALSPRISVTALILAAIGIGAAFYASRFSFWDNAYYKDVIMWALFAGWPLCFGAISFFEAVFAFYFALALGTLGRMHDFICAMILGLNMQKTYVAD